MESLGRIPKRSDRSDPSNYKPKTEPSDPRLRPQQPYSSTSASSTSYGQSYAQRMPAMNAAMKNVDLADEEEDQVLQEILRDPSDSDDELDVPAPASYSYSHPQPQSQPHSHSQPRPAQASSSSGKANGSTSGTKKPSKRRSNATSESVGGTDPDGVKRDYGSLRLTQKLPDYDVMRLTARDLHDLIHEGYIDLDPEYQRDVVWPDKKQIMLIDSMLNNFYIPAVIFSVRRQWDDGKGMDVEQRVCMDGKQRLTSMVRFMDGLIPYVHNNGIKYWYDVPVGENPKRNLPLPDRLRREFDQKPISCIQYQDINEDDEREIFRRVQLGVALSPAEKLQGITSPFADFVRQLQKQYVDAEHTLGDSIQWQKKRGVDFACVAQILFALYNLPNFSWPGLTTLEKFLRKKEVPTKSFKLEVLQIFADYVALARDHRYNYGFKTIADRVSPVELVMIGLLIGYMKDCPPEQKAEHIRLLRKKTRDQFKDIRMNDRVTKYMWNYIKSIPVPKSYVPSKAEVSSGARKRKVSKHDADEYRPHPSRR